MIGGREERPSHVRKRGEGAKVHGETLKHAPTWKPLKEPSEAVAKQKS